MSIMCINGIDQARTWEIVQFQLACLCPQHDNLVAGKEGTAQGEATLPTANDISGTDVPNLGIAVSGREKHFVIRRDR